MPASLQRMLLLLSTLLLTSATHATGNSLVRRDGQTTYAAPISVSPDQNWDGIDGKWNTFTLRVGTPQQTVRTFLSFASYQTWVVVPEGCMNAADPDACAETRGGIFNVSESSTWQKAGIYDLWTEDNMGYSGNAIFGYDSMALGNLGENGPELRNTTVGGTAVEDFYIGIFGINPKPTNFTEFSQPSTSYMTQLKEQGMIPSVSFGYTAGAHYRFTGALASLTLGGYDSNKYVANNITFAFGPDNERDLVLGLQQITTPSSNPSVPTATQLLPSPIYILVDTTIPEIWLPLEACQAFEYTFGLVWNDTYQLYLVNDTQHNALLQRNANVSFTLGQGFTDSETVQITLPYAAFDLEAKPPFQRLPNNTNYFPLKRAANDTQYLLGRTFMQEAYITVDYEASRFQLSQVLWDQTTDQNLVSILPFNRSNPGTDWTSPLWGEDTKNKTGDGSTSSGSSSSSGSSGIGAGAIAGIVVGVVAIIAILLAVFWYRRRSQQKQLAAKEAHEMKEEYASGSESDRGRTATVFPKAELDGSSPSPFGMTHHDLDRKGLLSAHPSSRLNSPQSPAGTSPSGYFGHGRSDSSAFTPITPGAGESTHSSSQSGTLLSPISHASEADSKQVAIYEMPGDMPVIREKDGKLLSEKEALQRREQIYNGIDSSANTPTDAAPETARDFRRVNAEDVVDVRTGAAHGRHRAFSFEADPSERDFYK